MIFEKNHKLYKVVLYFCEIMKSATTNKELVIKSVMKMITDKESVRSYIKGQTTIKSLNKKGIKLAKPL